MPNQFNQPINPSGTKPSFQPQLPKKLGLPTWASVLIVVVTAVIMVSLVSWAAYRAFNPLPITPIACTEEAKVCPDGTTVGRIPPKCEFAPCSSTQTPPDKTAIWQTYRNEEYGVEFKNPPEWVFDNQNRWTRADGDFYSFGTEDYNSVIEEWIPSIDDIFGENRLSFIKNVDIDGVSGKMGYRLREELDHENAKTIVQVIFMKNIRVHYLKMIIKDKNEGIDIINQILSTFKFIEADETAIWQTYQNEE